VALKDLSALGHRLLVSEAGVAPVGPEFPKMLYHDELPATIAEHEEHQNQLEAQGYKAAAVAPVSEAAPVGGIMLPQPPEPNMLTTFTASLNA
jgi:hypothetical protein